MSRNMVWEVGVSLAGKRRWLYLNQALRPETAAAAGPAAQPATRIMDEQPQRSETSHATKSPVG